MAKKIVGYIKLQVPAGKANPVAADRPRARSARPQHHGILQGVQRQDAGAWSRALPIPVVITVYRGPQLHLHHEDAAGATFLIKKAAKLDKGGAEAGSRQGRAPSPARRCERSPRLKMKDLNADDMDAAVQDHRRLAPARWASRWWSLSMANVIKAPEGASEGIDRNRKPIRWTSAEAGQGTATAKFDETVEVAMNLGVDPAQGRPDGARRRACCRTAPARPCASPCSPRATRPKKAQGRRRRHGRRRGPGRARSRAARSISTWHRHAGHDARGRPARQGARPARPDAEPEGRHGDAGRGRRVKNAKAGQVQFRVDKAGIVHCTIGRASFSVGDLKENLAALLDALQRAKPASSKGIYFKRLSVSSTMGVGVRVDQASVSA